MKYLSRLFLCGLIFALAACSTLPSRYLQVAIRGGRAIMPPTNKSSSYIPVVFNIPPGVCQAVNLRSVDLKRSTILQICYKNEILSVQPQHPNPKLQAYPIRLFAMPFWGQGFVYRNLSTGKYLYLRNITIKVQKKHVTTKNSSSRYLNRSVHSRAGS